MGDMGDAEGVAPMKPKFNIRTHRFRDKLWKILWRAPHPDKNLPSGHEYFGDCDWEKSTLKIYPSEDGLELLDTVLEETFHACFYDLDDPSVREAVRDIIELLRRMKMRVSFGE